MNHRKASKRWPHVLVAAAISLATVGLTVQVQAASATPALPQASNDSTEASPERLKGLLQRLDQALGQDGQLL